MIIEINDEVNQMKIKNLNGGLSQKLVFLDSHPVFSNEFFFLLQCSLGSDDDIDGNDGGVGGGLHSHLCQLVNES